MRGVSRDLSPEDTPILYPGGDKAEAPGNICYYDNFILLLYLEQPAHRCIRR